MNKKSILLALVIAASNLPSFAKLECVDGVVKKNGRDLTAKQVAKRKEKVSKKLAKVSEEKTKVKNPEKRKTRQTKLSAKLSLLESCKAD